MKTFLFALAAVAAFFSGGCSHVDPMAPGGADRVLTGHVTNHSGGGALPANSEVWIQVVDRGRGMSRGEVLGETTILNPSRMPVPFRIEFRAEDAVLRGTVEVEARISVDGRLRYITKAAHPVTLTNVGETHMIAVEAPGKQ